MLYRVSFYTEPIKVTADDDVGAIKEARRRIFNRRKRTHRIALIVKELKRGNPNGNIIADCS